MRAEVIPRRLSELRDNIDAHGARMATVPGWTQAKLKKEREPLARQYVLDTFGIKAPGLIEALMRAAQAQATASFEF